MTLEEKALEYSLKINGFTKEDCYNEKGELFQFIKSDIDIYLAGARELEQENNRLKEQIDKTKCCQNCEMFTYHNYASCGEPVLIDKSHGIYICNKWKLREKWDE